MLEMTSLLTTIATEIITDHIPAVAVLSHALRLAGSDAQVCALDDEAVRV